MQKISGMVHYNQRTLDIESHFRWQVDGHIDAKAKPEDLADYLVTTVIGLKTQVKAGASSKQIVNIAQLSVSALQRMG